jgi:hypothetical protein
VESPRLFRARAGRREPGISISNDEIRMTSQFPNDEEQAMDLSDVHFTGLPAIAVLPSFAIRVSSFGLGTIWPLNAPSSVD